MLSRCFCRWIKSKTLVPRKSTLGNTTCRALRTPTPGRGSCFVERSEPEPCNRCGLQGKFILGTSKFLKEELRLYSRTSGVCTIWISETVTRASNAELKNLKNEEHSELLFRLLAEVEQGNVFSPLVQTGGISTFVERGSFEWGA